MERFVEALGDRLTRDGYLSARAQAMRLGVDPATWSRARRGLLRFSPQIVQRGIARYPELAFYLASTRTLTSVA